MIDVHRGGRGGGDLLNNISLCCQRGVDGDADGDDGEGARFVRFVRVVWRCNSLPSRIRYFGFGIPILSLKRRPARETGTRFCKQEELVLS